MKGASRRVGAFQRVDRQLVGVGQDLVDLADVAPASLRGAGLVAGEAAAGGRAAAQRRDAAFEPMIQPRLQPREAARLARQVVEGGREGGEALAEPRGVDRIVRR